MPDPVGYYQPNPEFWGGPQIHNNIFGISNHGGASQGGDEAGADYYMVTAHTSLQSTNLDKFEQSGFPPFPPLNNTPCVIWNPAD